MSFRSRLLAFVLVFALCSIFVSRASAAQAQTGGSYPAEFREMFTVYMAWLDSHTSQNMNLEAKVRAMTDDEFQALYDSFADPDAFIAQTEQVMAGTFQVQAAPVLRAFAPQAAAAATLFSPLYPSGDSYNVWVATLPGFGLLSDEDGNGTTVNDRCDTNGEANLGIVGAALDVAAIAGDTACNSIEGGPEMLVPKIATCAATGILHEAAYANQIVMNQCSFQDGSVDSAELQAAYENSKIIADEVGNVTTQLVDISTQLTDVAIQIEGVSSQIDGVSTQIATHDKEIKTILETNHTEVMTTLAENQAEVMNTLAANQAQSLKIEIEKALADTNDNARLSYFYLPQAQGGLLELVRQTVSDAMKANQAAGVSIGNAQAWFAKAEASFASKQYKTAYDQYGMAYRETVK